MKRIIFIFIFLSSINCFSQTYNDRPTVLEVGYGVAIPFGKFESATVADSASGYAIAGTNLNVMLSWLLNKNIGVAAMISSTSSKLNTTGVKNRYEAYAHNIEGEVSDLHTKKWNTMAYMAGGYFSYPLQKASFNIQLLLGYSTSEYPETNATIYSQLDSNSVDVSMSASKIASAFCFNVGGGLKYNISDIMCLCVSVNYFSSYPEFDDVTTASTFQNKTPDELHIVHQRISLLNATAGIGFRF